MAIAGEPELNVADGLGEGGIGEGIDVVDDSDAGALAGGGGMEEGRFVAVAFGWVMPLVLLGAVSCVLGIG